MKFWPISLGFVLVLGGPVLAAPATQPLLIAVHGDGARATQLPSYDPQIPIAIRVEEAGAVVTDSVNVAASGPAGESVELQLDRGSDGAFNGLLSLPDPGSWQLHLTSHAGRIRTDTTPVRLDVEPAPPSNAWQIGFAIGAAIFILVGGGGFYILKRMLHAEPRNASAV